MKLSTLTDTLTDFIQTSPLNRAHDMADLQLFDAPLFGVASANDELFPQLRQPSIIIETYLLPTDWLPTAKSIISFFFAIYYGGSRFQSTAGITFDGMAVRTD